MHESIVKLDALLQRSDSDSVVWADGGGAEEADEMLAALSEKEWPELKSLYSSRNPAWRACLASVLRPQHGRFAEHLMLDLAREQDPEVAFLVVSGIAFYCGVNDSAQGPFVDPGIQNASFLSLARTTTGLTDQVLRVSASCNSIFQRRFELLAKLLESGA
jgi:hypothetical protein